MSKAGISLLSTKHALTILGFQAILSGHDGSSSERPAGNRQSDHRP